MFTHGGSNRQPRYGAKGVEPGAIVSQRSMACVTMVFRRSGWWCSIAVCEATACWGYSPSLPTCSGYCSTGTICARGRILAVTTHNTLRHRMFRVARLHVTARLLGVLVTGGALGACTAGTDSRSAITRFAATRSTCRSWSCIRCVADVALGVPYPASHRRFDPTVAQRGRRSRGQSPQARASDSSLMLTVRVTVRVS